MDDIKDQYIEVIRQAKEDFMVRVFDSIKERWHHSYGELYFEGVVITSTSDNLYFWINDMPWKVSIYSNPYNITADVNITNEEPTIDYFLQTVYYSELIKHLETCSDQWDNDESDTVKKMTRIRLNKLKLANKNTNLRDAGLFEVKRFNDL